MLLLSSCLFSPAAALSVGKGIRGLTVPAEDSAMQLEIAAESKSSEAARGKPTVGGDCSLSGRLWSGNFTPTTAESTDVN